MIGIYKITNKLNGKIYIGQSINIERRLSEHKRYKDTEQSIDKAIRDEGQNNFLYDVIEECEANVLDEREKYWIDYYKSYINGYNDTSGGKGRSNSYVKLTYENIVKIHQLLKEYILTQNEIADIFGVSYQVISDINRGKSHVLPNIKYPIRKENIQKKQAKENNKEKSKKLVISHVCERCGKPITKGHKYCVECCHLMEQKVQRPDPETLLQEIATSSFVKVGQKYGVSDKAIVKWCIAYGLPSKKQELKELYKRRVNQ